MKKILLIITLLIVLPLCVSFVIAETKQDDFLDSIPELDVLPVVMPDDSITYIEKKDILVEKSNNRVTVDLWITYFYENDKEKELDLLHYFKFSNDMLEKISYKKLHYKITSDRFMTTEVGASFWNENHEIVMSKPDGIDYKWNDIIPNSYGQELYDTVFNYLKRIDKI